MLGRALCTRADPTTDLDDFVDSLLTCHAVTGSATTPCALGKPWDAHWAPAAPVQHDGTASPPSCQPLPPGGLKRGAPDGEACHAIDCSRDVGHPVCVKITNATYLRKLCLSTHKAVRLVPVLAQTLASLKAVRPSRSTKSRHNVRTVVCLRSDDTRWRVALDCAWSAKRQLHCRLGEGWPCFCRDAGVSVGDVVRFETRVESTEVVVRVERWSRPQGEGRDCRVS